MENGLNAAGATVQSAPAADAERVDAAAGNGSAQLGPADVSRFCEGMAIMLSSGIQVDEALGLLGAQHDGSPLSAACSKAYEIASEGAGLTDSLKATGAFPPHALGIMAVGERSGRLEQSLRHLMRYYDEESRMFSKLRTAVGYPAALLCVMTVIVAFTAWVVLPVFVSVYEGLAGSLTAGSSGSIAASIAIGWVALVITLAGAIATVSAAVASRTPRGNAAMLRFLARFPLTRNAMRKQALSRFLLVLSTHIASGAHDDAALAETIESTDHPDIRSRAEKALELVIDPERGMSLTAAMAQVGMMDDTHSRMLAICARTGGLDNALSDLGEDLFDESVEDIDRVIDGVEPALAALLTITVGATLMSVMLPLIGIMGSIG